MNEVFKKTRELGEAIMNSPEYTNMKQMEKRAMANADAAQAMGEFLEKRGQIERMLEQENPDSEQLRALSNEMEQAQQRLQMIDEVQALTEARNQFSNLIEQVNDVLRFIITGDTSEARGDCSGSCGGCSGCGHTLH